MSKGSYPVMWNGSVHGHLIYTEGSGWGYRALPSDDGWVSLAAPRQTGEAR